MEAADQLALGLGQVERRAVGLADHRDHVDDERRDSSSDGTNQQSSCCAATISRRRHRAGVEEHRDERQAHRDLVGDHLGRERRPPSSG